MRTFVNFRRREGSAVLIVLTVMTIMTALFLANGAAVRSVRRELEWVDREHAARWKSQVITNLPAPRAVGDAK